MNSVSVQKIEQELDRQVMLQNQSCARMLHVSVVPFLFCGWVAWLERTFRQCKSEFLGNAMFYLLLTFQTHQVHLQIQE